MLHRAIRKRFPAMLGALIAAMLCGRIVGGAAKALLLLGGVIPGTPLTFKAFLTGYFVDTAVGAAIHIILVPAVVTVLERARLSPVSHDLSA